jgi:hypothetical protein
VEFTTLLHIAHKLRGVLSLNCICGRQIMNDKSLRKRVKFAPEAGHREAK